MKFLKPDKFKPLADQIFKDLKENLESKLNDPCIEHIGASSIKGAISKGDLDIYVAVSKQDFNESIDKIIELGFLEKQGTLRTEELCMLESSEFDIDTAIQLVVKNSEFEMFLKFRDKLNSTPALVEDYNELKCSCEGMSEDDYRKIKSNFIQKILEE